MDTTTTRPIPAPAAPERSTPDLVKDLSEQVSRLVRDELKLAQLEMSSKGKQAGLGIGMLGGGGLISLYGLACLVAAAVIAIALVLPAWAAALIIGGALLAVAGIAALLGRGRLRKAAPPVPRQAIVNLRADVEAIREGAHR